MVLTSFCELSSNQAEESLGIVFLCIVSSFLKWNGFPGRRCAEKHTSPDRTSSWLFDLVFAYDETRQTAGSPIRVLERCA